MSREEEIRGPAPEENGRTGGNPRFSGRQRIFSSCTGPHGRGRGEGGLPAGPEAGDATDSKAGPGREMPSGKCFRRAVFGMIKLSAGWNCSKFRIPASDPAAAQRDVSEA